MYIIVQLNKSIIAILQNIFLDVLREILQFLDNINLPIIWKTKLNYLETYTIEIVQILSNTVTNKTFCNLFSSFLNPHTYGINNFLTYCFYNICEIIIETFLWKSSVTEKQFFRCILNFLAPSRGIRLETNKTNN